MDLFFELLGIDAQAYLLSLLPLVVVVVVVVLFLAFYYFGFFSAEVKKKSHRTYRH